MYRHIDILNKHGYHAYALHIQKDFRLTWFDNETRVVHFDEFKTMYHAERDFIVLPEDLGDKILSFPGKKVIFNQGVYLGFYCLGFEKPKAYPYLHPDIKGVMVVSDHNREYLHFVYPESKIYRVYNAIEPERFMYQPVSNKKKIISCLPSKNPVDLSQVYHILMSRAEQGLNNLKEYEWIFIKNRSEAEVADILRNSLAFIFLSTEEGFPLMPVEAMLSGSLVAAYNAGPLTEYLYDRNSFIAPKGDVLDVVKSIEKITQFFSEDIGRLQMISKTAWETASQYSLQREEESIITVWQEIEGI